MSVRTEEIVCRKCDEVFPIREGNCPECGTSVRGRFGAAVVIAVGLFMVLTSLSPFEALYAGVGLVLLVLGGHVVRDRRARIREAQVRRGRRRPSPAR